MSQYRCVGSAAKAPSDPPSLSGYALDGWRAAYRAALLGFLFICTPACRAPADRTAVPPTGAALTRTDTVQALAANGHVLVAGTQNGALLSSPDLGRTWKRQELGHLSVIGMTTCPNEHFVAIDFYRTVWTADSSGERWFKTAFSGSWTPLAVTCDSRGRWWLAGTNATIAMSGDGGSTWHTTTLGEDLHLTAIQFQSEQFGAAVGEFGTVVTTRDGGTTWKRMTAIPADFYPYSVLFVDDTNGYVSGVAGQTLLTQDGGASWQAMENTTSTPLYRLFAQGGEVWGVGAVGVIAKVAQGRWLSVSYSDSKPVPIGTGISIPGRGVAIGGPGGFYRLIPQTSEAVRSPRAFASSRPLLAGGRTHETGGAQP
jgi:photosystem II stability/assembly factor-like uncharacterized protein